MENGHPMGIQGCGVYILLFTLFIHHVCSVMNVCNTVKSLFYGQCSSVK